MLYSIRRSVRTLWKIFIRITLYSSVLYYKKSKNVNGLATQIRSDWSYLTAIPSGSKCPLRTDIFADQVFSKCYVLRHYIRLQSFADNVNFWVPATKGEVRSPHPLNTFKTTHDAATKTTQNNAYIISII